MHESEPNDQLAPLRTGNRACTQCHEAFEDPSKRIAHTRHREGSSGSECYNCHMPHTTYGVLKAIRSHQISSPRIDQQLATGRPNACNLCHLDRTLGWSAGYLTEWFGHPTPGLSVDQMEVADSVLLALTGDAGQRALIGWHLGWDAARSVSGTDWIAPILGMLLDDPYAAVRCVAERSLKQTEGFVPEGYDYVLSPKDRPQVRSRVEEAWRTKLQGRSDPNLPAQTLLGGGSTSGRDRIESLIRRRDDRAVRLRE